MSISDEILEAYGRQLLDDVCYWVYVLKCKPVEWEFDDLKRRAESRLGEEPWYLRPAFEHDWQYYIGQTENLEKRLGQHFKQHNSSNFTQMFEPVAIQRLEPRASRRAAKRRENQLSEQFTSSDRVFAYAN